MQTATGSAPACPTATPHNPATNPSGLTPRALAALYLALFGSPADPARHYPGRASW
jgi:hypothetical protein